MRSFRLGLALPLFLVACGGDDGAGVPDAERSPDAEIPDAAIPDAEPPPDAAPAADLSCLDTAQPTAGPDPVTINGVASSASTSGLSDLENAIATAYRVGDDVTVQSTDTSDSTGAFTLTIDNDALTPVDGYVKGTATSYLDSYLYPPFPLAADTDQAPLLFISNDTLNLLAFASQASQRADHGFLGIAVLDCSGSPVAGATVTISPTATGTPVTKIVYVGSNNLPDTSLTSTGANGLAFVFNAPQGEVVVDASVDGMSLDEHTITVRITDGVPNDFPAVTQTAIAPGPITP